LPKFALILLYHERRKHQQGDGKKDEEEGEFRFRTRGISLVMTFFILQL
jgi:hypothetical protein